MNNAMFVERKFKHSRNHRKMTCIVGKREGCWSKNHPSTQRLKSLRQNKIFRQFLTDIQQEDQDEEAAEAADELVDIAAHMLETKTMINDEEDELPAPNIQVCNIHSEKNVEAYFALTRDSSAMHALSADLPDIQ